MPYAGILSLCIGVNSDCEKLMSDTAWPFPNEKSDLVCSVKKDLLCKLKIRDIIEGLDKVGTFIRIVDTCVTAAGSKFHTFQIEIQSLESKTAILLNNSAFVVDDFTTTSQKILCHLEDAYHYLIECRVDLSISRLSELESLAKECSSIANKLSSDFREHEQQVWMALKKILDVKACEELQKERIMQEENNRIEKIFEEYYHQNEEAKEKILKDNEESNWSTKVLLLFSMESAQDNFFVTENGMELLQIQQKKALSVECVNDFLTALESSSSFECHLISISATALHNASEALKYLQYVMLNFAHYWSQLQKRYANFSDPYIRKDIETFKCSPLKSPTFMKSFMKFCSQFVALHCICSEVFDKIKLIQEDLKITQPQILTYEEAEQILKDHCKRVLHNYMQPTFK